MQIRLPLCKAIGKLAEAGEEERTRTSNGEGISNRPVMEKTKWQWRRRRGGTCGNRKGDGEVEEEDRSGMGRVDIRVDEGKKGSPSRHENRSGDNCWPCVEKNKVD